MLAALDKGRTLMKGTTGMRAAGEKYLPKFGAETDDAYKERKALSWLFNGYRKTVKDMVGRVFDEPVRPNEEVPARIDDMLENIDNLGRDLSTFARQVFEDAMSGAGISYIMVDAPRREGTVTQAEARRQNLRPYMVHLRVEDILGWKAQTVDNVMRLTQIRILETVNEDDPKDEFKEREVEQIRVMDRLAGSVSVRIFRKDGDKKWFLHDEWAIPIAEIPVVPVYLNRTGFFTGEPLLDDLADVNIAHWQSQSDQRNILHFARVPILFASGIPEDDQITISASTAVKSSDPAAKLAWVEHSGNAISAGRQDLKDLEFQMETHGLQLLVAQNAQAGATGAVLDAQKETSTLAMSADQLADALEQALQFMAEFAGEATGGSVIVNKDFGVGDLTSQELQVMLQAVATGNMSQETFIAAALRFLAGKGVVAEDMDVDEEMQRIQDEGGVVLDATDPANADQ